MWGIVNKGFFMFKRFSVLVEEENVFKELNKQAEITLLNS
jgi:hypothetical protein